jgi:hypothetical protein
VIVVTHAALTVSLTMCELRPAADFHRLTRATHQVVDRTEPELVTCENCQGVMSRLSCMPAAGERASAPVAMPPATKRDVRGEERPCWGVRPLHAVSQVRP